MKITKDIFNLTEVQRSDVGIKISKIGKVDSEILCIFWLNEQKLKTEKPLTVDDIVGAYYNIFTEKKGRPKKNKKAIIMRLFLLKGGKENNGLIKTDGKGVYMVRKPDELKTDWQHELFNQYKAKWQQWEKEYETE